MQIDGVNVGTICNVSNKLMEISYNNEFSSFIEEHYYELLSRAKLMNVHDTKVEDMLHDVYLSYLKNEEEGDGFDCCKGRQSGYITVEQAVYGRLKLYSKNSRYQKPTEKPRMKPNGQDYEYKEVPSTSLSNDVSTLSACEKFYAECASIDDLEFVEEKESFMEQLNFVMSFENDFNISISGFLRNLESIVESINNISPTLFNEFGNAGEEFKEALCSVLEFSFRQPEYFKSVILSMGT